MVDVVAGSGVSGIDASLDAGAGDYDAKWWNGATSFDDATPVVGSDESVTGIDAALS